MTKVQAAILYTIFAYETIRMAFFLAAIAYKIFTGIAKAIKEKDWE